MKTLKGVIAATTGKGEVVPDESDLHIQSWFFILSSNTYTDEDNYELTVELQIGISHENT